VPEFRPVPSPAPGGRSPLRSPAWLLVAGLSVFLLLPLRGRHLYPDQDIPIGLALADMVRGDWRPATLVYPTALTNLLRALFRVWLILAPGDTGTVDDLLAAWCTDPWPLRTVPRAVAVVAGIASLAASLRLGTLAAGPAAGMLAALYLGTAVGFVREHSHGMLDAPAAAAATLALLFASRHVQTGSPAAAILAGLCSGLACSFKYHLALVGLGVLAGLLLAPVASRRHLAVALGAGLAAVLATSPGLALDPLRAWQELAAFVPRQTSVLEAASSEGNRMLAALALGLGWPVLALAASGAAIALWKRERVLAPLGGFLVAYGALLAATPLVLNRYALPLMAPLAVLAARAVAAIPGRTARLLVTAVVLLAGAPETAHQIRLTLAEDTRTAAARWIEAQLPRTTPLYLTSGVYAAPDVLAAALDPFAQVPGGLGRPLPAVCARRRPLQVLSMLPRSPAQLVALFRGGVVLTAEPPSAVFAPLSTPPAVLALLETHGREIAAFRSEATPGQQPVWEPFDQNYLPLAGAGALDRPGPTIRLWRVGPEPVTSPGAQNGP